MGKNYFVAGLLATAGFALFLTGSNASASIIADQYTSGQELPIAAGNYKVCVKKDGGYSGNQILADIRGTDYEKQILFSDFSENESCVELEDVPSDAKLKYILPMGMENLGYTSSTGSTVNATRLNLNTATTIEKFLKISGLSGRRVDGQVIETNLQSGQNVNQALKRLVGNGDETYSTYESKIKNIKFVRRLPASINPETAAKVNIAAENEVPVYAYTDGVTGDIYIYSEANKIYANSDSSYMFYNMHGMYSGVLTFTKEFNTSKVTNMHYMFNNFSAQSLVLPESFDTSNVTDMSGMFYYYTSLRSLTLPSTFNTAKVTDMNHMFYYTSSLRELDLPESFNTSKVTDMSDMFHGASTLTTLTLPSSFSPSKAVNMSNMFHYMSSLTTLNLPSTFSTASATNMNNMFSGMSCLTSLVLPESFNTSKVTDMGEMFANSYDLTELELPEAFDTSKVTNMSYMFSSVRDLTELNLPASFSTASATNISGMFNYMTGLETLVLSDDYAIKPGVSSSSIFGNIPETATLCSIDYTARSLWPGVIGCTTILQDGPTANDAITSLDGNYGSNIASLQFVRTLPNTIDPETSTKVNIALEGQEPVYAYIDDNNNVYIYTEAKTIIANKNSSKLFYYLSNITTLELPNYFDAYNISIMDSMFGHLDSVTSIVLPESFKLNGSVLSMRMAFYKNPELQSLTLPDTFVVGPFTDTEGIFDALSSDAVLYSSDAILRSLWPGVLGN